MVEQSFNQTFIIIIGHKYLVLLLCLAKWANDKKNLLSPDQLGANKIKETLDVLLEHKMFTQIVKTQWHHFGNCYCHQWFIVVF